ncbi:unnamed protein product, partial [Rotaria sp. Silwood1]
KIKFNPKFRDLFLHGINRLF